MTDFNQTDVVAAVICDEARGDGTLGMAAVAEVIRMRVARSGWKLTPYDVVTRRHQFSGVERDGCARLVKRMRATPQWDQAVGFAILCEVRCQKRNATHGIARGATHFCSIYSKPAWAAGVEPCAVVGRHRFWRIDE